jgi:hypothetical protein
VFKLPKRKPGEYRLIYAPTGNHRKALQRIAVRLALAGETMITDEHPSHGFELGRSPVSNAMRHTDRQYTLCMDLVDFFDTVRPWMVPELGKCTVSLCFVDGAPRQGLPSSPAVANMAACRLDRLIQDWLRNAASGAVYTRYADDLAFSFDDVAIGGKLIEAIPVLATACGFKINTRKTRLQCAKAGVRIITGVAVCGELRPTRAAKRRLRAAVHRGRELSQHGLREWIRLVPPKLRGAASGNRAGLIAAAEDIAKEYLDKSAAEMLEKMGRLHVSVS